MKNLLLTFSLSLLCISSIFAQSQFGINTDTPKPSAVLDIESTDKGVLVPRVSTTQRSAIASPDTGLMVYDSTLQEFWYYDGVAWQGLVKKSNVETRLEWLLCQYIQTRLDSGETPISIYNSGCTLNDIYGKTYQGGIIAYLNTTTGAGLIAAPSDQHTMLAWYNGTYNVTGATGTAIGTGQANTTTIIAAITYGPGPYAAYLCDTLTLNGYSDWFLPSKDELNECYTNLHLNGFGGFTNIGYWNSTEFSSNNSWFQTFSTGVQINAAKLNTTRVRAVRTF